MAVTDHPRKTVRDKVKSILLSRTDVGSNVESNRVRPIRESELPRILVYTKNEPIEDQDELPKKRELTIAVEILVKKTSELDNDIDAIAKQVEQIMEEDDRLSDGEGNCLVDDLVFTNVDIDMVNEGSLQMGSCVNTYQAKYNTRRFDDTLPS